MKQHIVYLSFTSNFKVGITRKTNIPYRWIDQGALEAVALFEVSERFHAGLIEKHLSNFINDKTHWRNMLKTNDHRFIDMNAQIENLFDQSQIEKFISENEYLQQSPPKRLHPTKYRFYYPCNQVPTTTNSIKLDDDHSFISKLEGIKGQYLLFEHGTLNIRKYGGHQITLNY